VRHGTAIATTLGLALALVAGCQQQAPPPEAASATPAAEAQRPLRLAGVGFVTPESVLHDTEADLYLVSNVNGAPLAKDGNGFISRVSPEGTVTELKWIDGTDEAVTLDAPKGMAIVGDTLYVTDIDSVRLFERETGAPKGSIAIEGATFLNDLAPAPGGGVYLTDSGLKASESGFEPSGSAAVYEIGANGKVRTLIAGADLPAPNGVAADGDRVLVVTFGANELFTIADGKMVVLAKLPAGSLDGLVQLPDGRWAVSSWESQSIYAGPLEGPFETILTGMPAPADIGVDLKRQRLLVPRFQDNDVVIEPLQP